MMEMMEHLYMSKKKKKQKILQKHMQAEPKVCSFLYYWIKCEPFVLVKLFVNLTELCYKRNEMDVVLSKALAFVFFFYEKQR